MFFNVDRESLFGQELLALIRELKLKNVLKTQGYSAMIKMNYSKYQELVSTSSLIDELQYIIFGYYNPPKREELIKEKLQKEIV